MTGTPSQIEWAEQFKPRVGLEFDRVAEAFRAVAQKQNESQQLDTETILAILEEKRLEVMARNEAGYFIRDWQELRDQVRQLIAKDSRFDAILARRQGRSRKDAQ